MTNMSEHQSSYINDVWQGYTTQSSFKIKWEINLIYFKLDFKSEKW